MKYLIAIMMLISVPAHAIFNLELAIPDKQPSIVTINEVCVQGLAFLITSTRSGNYNSVQSHTIQIFVPSKNNNFGSQPKKCGTDRG